MNMITLGQYCTRPHGTQCTRCQTACPHGAISFSQEGLPVIDNEACTRCAVCMGVCDEFSASTTSARGLYEHLKKVALAGELVDLTCKENVFPGLEPARNVTVLPCLACMPAELWTLLLAENVPLCLAMDLKYCDKCTKAPHIGELLFSRCVELAEARTGNQVRFDRVIPELTEEDKAAAAAGNPSHRREAFESVKDDALGIVNGTRHLKNSDTLKHVYRDRERNRMRGLLNLADRKAVDESLGGAKTQRVMFPSHKMLLESVAACDQCRTSVEILASATDADCCVDCFACTKACPSHARLEANDKLDYDPRYCIGCGACALACEKDAVYFVEGTARDVLPDFVAHIDPLKAQATTAKQAKKPRR